MKTLFLYTIFLLTCGSDASEKMNDAKEIMRLLQMTIKNINRARTVKCYFYQPSAYDNRLYDKSANRHYDKAYENFFVAVL